MLLELASILRSREEQDIGPENPGQEFFHETISCGAGKGRTIYSRRVLHTSRVPAVVS